MAHTIDALEPIVGVRAEQIRRVFSLDAYRIAVDNELRTARIEYLRMLRRSDDAAHDIDAVTLIVGSIRSSLLDMEYANHMALYQSKREHMDIEETVKLLQMRKNPAADDLAFIAAVHVEMRARIERDDVSSYADVIKSTLPSKSSYMHYIDCVSKQFPWQPLEIFRYNPLPIDSTEPGVRAVSSVVRFAESLDRKNREDIADIIYNP